MKKRIFLELILRHENNLGFGIWNQRLKISSEFSPSGKLNLVNLDNSWKCETKYQKRRKTGKGRFSVKFLFDDVVKRNSIINS